jgi:hypothetical protein
MREQGMMDWDTGIDEVDTRVARALELKPEVKIPVGFAARVAAQAPVRRAVALRPARYGRMAMWAALALLVVALVAMGTRPGLRTEFGLWMEWILCAELIGIALWLGGVRISRAADA